MNIEKWHNNYITDISQKYNSEATIRMYSHNVLKFLKHFETCREPKEIPTQEIKEYLLRFNTLNTRKQNLCAIRKFYEFTINMPKKVLSIPYPKKQRKLPRVIETEFLVGTIKNNIPNLKHKALISLGYDCALRREEVINLKTCNIDRKRMLILIENGKGNKDRYVKLSESLLSILEQYARKYKPKTYLFNGESKTSLKYSSSSYNNVVKKYLGEEYSSHSLRHSSATTMLENGTPLPIIKELLGHNSIKTTEIYTHVSLTSIQRAYSPLS